jgi:hypothetical protein
VLAYKTREKICEVYILKSVIYININKLNTSKGSSKKKSLTSVPRHTLKAPIFTRLIIKVFTSKSAYNSRTYTASTKDSLISTLGAREKRLLRRF